MTLVQVLESQVWVLTWSHIQVQVSQSQIQEQRLCTGVQVLVPSSTSLANAEHAGQVIIKFTLCFE